MNEKTNGLQRILESHASQQTRATPHTQALLKVVTAFAERDTALQGQMKELLSQRDESDAALKSAVDQLFHIKTEEDRRILTQMDVLFKESAENVAEIQRFVESFHAKSDAGMVRPRC